MKMGSADSGGDVMLTYERAHDRLRQDPETGELYWKIDHWKKVKAGQVAGDLYRNGYRRVCLDSKDYLAHRVVWLMTYGVWPEVQIDHINGNRTDNRVCNLRAATSGENHQNLARRLDNSSGRIGVSQWARTGKWRADITVKGRQVYLGTFNTAEEADVAYREAKARLHTFNPIPREAA